MAKKAKLTKEERAARKAQAKQRAEEAKKELRREHLEREIVLAEQSWQKLKRQFKEMMLKIQMPAIQHDIEILWRSYDSALDRKDYVIEKLLEQLDERDFLRQRCFAEHASSLSTMIALKERRAQAAQAAFEHEREEDLERREERTAQVAEERTAQRVRFNVISNAMAARADEAIINMRSEYMLRLDDDRDKMNDARKVVKVLLEDRLEEAWRQLGAALATYEASTKDRRRRLEAIEVEDARSSAILQRQEQRMQQLQATEELMRWRLSHEDPTQVLRGRVSEQRYLSSAYTALRVRLEDDRKHDGARLAHLSVCSNDALEKLRRLVKKAQRVFVLANNCRPLETREERTAVDACAANSHATLREGDDDNVVLEEAKTVESSASTLQSQTSQTSSTASTGQSDGSAEGGEKSEPMLGFWQRVARADAARADILATLQALREEQASLRRALRCCLRSVDSLRPLEVDPRHCAEACHDGSTSRTPFPNHSQNVVEASHVYKNLNW